MHDRRPGHFRRVRPHFFACRLRRRCGLRRHPAGDVRGRGAIRIAPASSSGSATPMLSPPACRCCCSPVAGLLGPFALLLFGPGFLAGLGAARRALPVAVRALGLRADEPGAVDLRPIPMPACRRWRRGSPDADRRQYAARAALRPDGRVAGGAFCDHDLVGGAVADHAQLSSGSTCRSCPAFLQAAAAVKMASAE